MKKKVLALCLIWAAVLAIAAMIFLFSAQDGEASSHTSDGIVYFLLRLKHPDYDDLPQAERRSLYSAYQYYVRKGAHLTEFAMLGASLRVLFQALKRRRPLIGAWMAGTLYACTDELHQKILGTRSGMWQDVCIDSAGVLLGAALAALVLMLWRRRKEKYAKA